MSKEMGSVVVAPSNEELNGDTASVPLNLRGDDLDKTLQDARFVIGDFVDCAIFPPLGDGTVVSHPRTQGYAGGSRTASALPRENGFSRGRGGGYGGGGRGGYGGGYGRDFGGNIPSGEWRRGERLPDTGYGSGRGYDGRRDRGRGPY